mgnify:CR=1 FL=1
MGCVSARPTVAPGVREKVPADESAAVGSCGVHSLAVGVIEDAVGIAVVASESIEGETVGVGEEPESIVNSEGSSEGPRGRTGNK